MVETYPDTGTPPIVASENAATSQARQDLERLQAQNREQQRREHDAELQYANYAAQSRSLGWLAKEKEQLAMVEAIKRDNAQRQAQRDKEIQAVVDRIAATEGDEVATAAARQNEQKALRDELEKHKAQFAEWEAARDKWIERDLKAGAETRAKNTEAALEADRREYQLKKERMEARLGELESSSRADETRIEAEKKTEIEKSQEQLRIEVEMKAAGDRLVNDIRAGSSVFDQVDDTFVNLSSPENPNTELDPRIVESYMNYMMRASSKGSYTSMLSTFMSQMDRFQAKILPPNAEHSGFTFMTRPKLNLTTASMKKSTLLLPYITENPTSLAFAVRCLLDTKFMTENLELAGQCPFLNTSNPFMIPISNGMTSFGSSPDKYMETFTSDPGFHEEDQTIAIGSDNLNKTYDLTLSFSDIEFGVIVSLFLVWFEYIRMLKTGEMTAYLEHVNRQKLNYTVSFYRFVMDPSRRFITRHARFMGCFPVAVPYGSMFNVNEGESFVSAIGKFSIPFKVNCVRYDDPDSLGDFNRLVRRYAGLEPFVESNGELKYIPPIDQYGNVDPRSAVYIQNPFNNFRGIPYVFQTPGAPRLEFIDPEYYKRVTMAKYGPEVQDFPDIKPNAFGDYDPMMDLPEFGPSFDPSTEPIRTNRSVA